MRRFRREGREGQEGCVKEPGIIYREEGEGLVNFAFHLHNFSWPLKNAPPLFAPDSLPVKNE